MSTLEDRTVVIIGGGSGIGLEVGRRAVEAGAEVVLGGRTAGKLDAAAQTIGARWQVVDNTDSTSLGNFFNAIPRVDHLFTPGASYQVGPMLELSDDAAASPFVTKFWGQYNAVRHAAERFTHESSVVLMSGAASVRPPAAAPAYVACNAAIEGLGRGLAVELAPVRVNVVSPGTIDGNLWSQRPASVREQSFTQYSNDTVLHRVGRESEIAEAVLYLFTATFTTGSTIYPDGGYSLR